MRYKFVHQIGKTDWEPKDTGADMLEDIVNSGGSLPGVDQEHGRITEVVRQQS